MSRLDALPDMRSPAGRLKSAGALTPLLPRLKGRKTTHGRRAFCFHQGRRTTEEQVHS
jgi:hypothetical protein